MGAAAGRAGRQVGRLGKLAGPADVMGSKPWATSGGDSAGNGISGQQRLAATVEAVERRMAEERMKLIKDRGLVGADGLADAIEDDKRERKVAAELAARAKKVAEDHKAFQQRQVDYAEALRRHDAVVQKKNEVQRNIDKGKLHSVAKAGLESFRTTRRAREAKEA